MALTIAAFEERHLEDAARLLAQRHARDRAREPTLPLAFEAVGTVRPLLDRQLRQEGAAGVVARRDGELAGFLVASAILPGPRHFLAKFFPPRSMAIPYQGYAIARDEGASLYRELYGALAAVFVRRGFFDHFINVAATDADAREAWDSLGFGRDSTCALRDVEQPVADASAVAVEVHQAGLEDIGVVEALARALAEHHTGSPIFSPLLDEPMENMHEMSQNLLADLSNPHFVAYRDGQPLGMDTFMPPRFLSPMQTPESCVYLFQGIVHPEARGAGVGRALLRHSMAWAREQGYRWCALHFAAANLSGAPFWLGNGFRPLEHRLRRHIDERIVWARG